MRRKRWHSSRWGFLCPASDYMQQWLLCMLLLGPSHETGEQGSMHVTKSYISFAELAVLCATRLASMQVVRTCVSGRGACVVRLPRAAMGSVRQRQ